MKVTIKFLALGLIVSALAACAGKGKDGGDSDTVDATEGQATTVSVSEDTTTQVSDSELRNQEVVRACLSPVLYFDFDKSTLTAKTRNDLDACASALRASPRNIRLEGHADERGTREYNIALGERRAKSVADYLIGSGVSASRIETISYGEERPAVSGNGNSAWQKNRRVELK